MALGGRYAVMVDADHTLEQAWRVRLAAWRLLQECRHRSVEVCNNAVNIMKTFSGQAHMWTRVFPAEGTPSASWLPALVRSPNTSSVRW